jgi:virulence-associated protein VapD
MRRSSSRRLRIVGNDSAEDNDAEAAQSEPRPCPDSHLSNRKTWAPRMYAIAFDLDQEMLQRHYPGNNYKNAYQDVRRVFESFGFQWQQGSLYFGDSRIINPVQCVLAVQEIVKRHPWFRTVVSDVRMLRIEENNDLMPAVGDYELPLGSS